MARLLPPARIHRTHDTWGRKVTGPAFAATNAVFFGAFLPIALTCRLRWEQVPTFPDDRQVVYYCWHRYAWVAYLLFGGLPPHLRPTAIAHDGVLSRINQRAGAWMGYPTLVFARGAAESPRAQIIEHARRAGCHLMLLPDSGGPYGQVKPGLVEIAQALGAWLQPFAVRTDGKVEVGAAQRHVCPLPFARVEVRVHDPLDGREATVEQCQRALEALERR